MLLNLRDKLNSMNESIKRIIKLVQSRELVQVYTISLFLLFV